jgi:hypothetical protein
LILQCSEDFGFILFWKRVGGFGFKSTGFECSDRMTYGSVGVSYIIFVILKDSKVIMHLIYLVLL